MEKAKIIREGGQFHIYFRDVDFWLSRQELLELFAVVLPYVKNESEKKG